MDQQNQKKIKYGIILGLVLGLSPFYSLQSILIFFLLLLIDFSLISFSVSFLVFKAIFTLLSPLFATLGLAVLELSLLSKPLSLIYNTPLLPLTFFNHAEVMGAMILCTFLLGITLMMNHFYKKEFHHALNFSKWYGRVAIVAIFMSYFFMNVSSNLKKSLESAISEITGATSTIEGLSFDSFPSKINIRNTNLSFDRQSLKIGNVDMSLNPMALLWARLNIEEVKVSGIDFNQSENNVVKRNIEDLKLKTQIKEELDRVSPGLSLDQFENLLNLGDPIEKINSINKILLAEKESDQLINKNHALIEKWSKEKDRLASTKNLSAELKKESLTRLEEEINRIEANQKTIHEKEIQDLSILKSELSIPKTNISDLSLQLFGKSIIEELASVKHYQFLSRKYLIQKKFNPTVVHFNVWNSYPTFEIKKLISVTKQNPTNLVNGSINFEVNDLSTDPLISNKPVLLFLSANFPKKAIRGVLATLSLDYGNKMTESLSLNIKSFPFKDNFFVSKLGIENGKGSLSYLIQFTNDKFRIEKTNEFKKFKPIVNLENKLIEKIATKSLTQASEIRIDSRIVGTWDSNNIQIKSKFGETLASELFEKNKSKLEALNPEIEQLFIQKIKNKKDEISEQVSTLLKIKEELSLL